MVGDKASEPHSGVMRTLVFLLASTAGLHCSGCTVSDALAMPGSSQVESTLDVRYHLEGARALHVDVHRLKTRSPVVVYVHGGGWSRGERPSRDAFARWFAMGFSVVAVEYRLSGEAPAPAAVRDVVCALGFLKRKGTSLGLDARQVVVEGGSAGAHLAMLAVAAAGDREFDAGCGPIPRVSAVVDRFGITDLPNWHPPSGAVARWLGPRAGDEEWMRRLSPLVRIKEGMPPLFIVHGDADRTVPIEQSRRLHDRALALGVPVALHVVPGGGHGGFSDAQEMRITASLAAFLQVNGASARKN